MTKSVRYSIADKTVELNFATDIEPQITKILVEEIGLYQTSQSTGDAEIIVNVSKDLPNVAIKQVNPSIHSEVDDGFIEQFKKYAIVIRKCEGQLVFDLAIDRCKNPLVNYLSKLNNLQYNSVIERAGHIFFENILTPAMYFDEDKFLLHASAFTNQNEEVFLIGGTGGVGKTSLELELCIKGNYRFLADDMAIIDQSGNVYPNLAFPKVYGYNLRNNPDLKDRIFQNRSLADKFAWTFRQAVFGDSGVRRKVSPREIFSRVSNVPAKLRHYIILVKEARQNIELTNITPQIASDMSHSVLQTELWAFNNHILWHEYNCQVTGSKPILSLRKTLNRWQNMTEKTLANIECHLLRIPLNLDHDEFLSVVSSMIGALD